MSTDRCSITRRPSARGRRPTCTSTNRRRVSTSVPTGGSSCQRRRTMTAAGGHGGATRPTEMGRDHEGDDRAETAPTDRIVSVGLGLSGLGPELRICARWFDSSRGHFALGGCSVWLNGAGHSRHMCRKGRLVPHRCPLQYEAIAAAPVETVTDASGREWKLKRLPGHSPASRSR